MKHPLDLFEEYFQEAVQAGQNDPDAVVVSTVGSDLRPSSRVVLYRGRHPEGLKFYTNYLSRKAHQIDENPWAAMLFFWPKVGRQIRFEGRLEKTSKEDSDAYWDGRPAGHQLGSLVSNQSQPIESIAMLRKKKAEMEVQTGGQKVPRPEGWGGYVLKAERIEFWKQGDDRLHEREEFRKEGTQWVRQLLSP